MCPVWQTVCSSHVILLTLGIYTLYDPSCKNYFHYSLLLVISGVCFPYFCDIWRQKANLVILFILSYPFFLAKCLNMRPKYHIQSPIQKPYILWLGFTFKTTKWVLHVLLQINYSSSTHIPNWPYTVRLFINCQL